MDLMMHLAKIEIPLADEADALCLGKVVLGVLVNRGTRECSLITINTNGTARQVFDDRFLHFFERAARIWASDKGYQYVPQRKAVFA